MLYLTAAQGPISPYFRRPNFVLILQIFDEEYGLQPLLYSIHMPELSIHKFCLTIERIEMFIFFVKVFARVLGKK